MEQSAIREAIESSLDSAARHSGRLQRRLRITGIVQGVGFRPYVWHLARDLNLTGWVRNDAAGVEVLVEGETEAIETFTRRLPAEIPPLAQVRELTWTDAPAQGAYADFAIHESQGGKAATMIGVDTAVCSACLAELFDPADRRHRYAFINCTHCGPRYTLTRRLPYDRAQTSMAAFPLCPACEREYRDPADRRFHAEPTACAVCGPKLWVEDFLPPPPGEGGPQGRVRERAASSDNACSLTPALPRRGREQTNPIAATLAHLRTGQIVAIKGLGGFHLACDARNAAAVARLRERKNREEKPFAVMAANVASLAGLVAMSNEERALLESAERPIVLLRKLDRHPGAGRGPEQPLDAGLRRHDEVNGPLPGIAPGLAWLGAMLPYTPIHWLLFHEAAGRPAGTAWMDQAQDLLLVMTSANPGGEPLVIGNDEAVERLAGIADAILMHDREIVIRCDDSVVRSTVTPAQAGVQRSATYWIPASAGMTTNTPPLAFIRRARGYTPRAIRLPHSGPSVLALGGHLKNTICVTRGDEAFVSQHIGGLDNAATCGMLMEVAEHLLHILDVHPTAVAHDLHPDFFSTRHALQLAESWGVPAIAVQHHHAHLAAVAAEHGIEEPILGLALDGVGLGTDGGAWGGELLRVEGAGQGGKFARLGHLAPLPLPGGDKAASQPWRMAAAVLHRLGRGDEIASRFADQPQAGQLLQLLERGFNCPPTTSLGRVFDAAAGLLGVRTAMAYEGQAAMLLEGLAEQFGEVDALVDGWHLQAAVIPAQAGIQPVPQLWTPASAGVTSQLNLLPLLALLSNEANPAYGAALFHATLAEALANWLLDAAQSQNIRTVAMGGGCFLNHILTRTLRTRLAEQGLTVLEARQVPPNDGGLSLGQAWVAMQTF